SPRTFSTVPCPRTSSLRAKQDRPCPFPFFIPPLSLLCSNRVTGKAKKEVHMPTLPACDGVLSERPTEYIVRHFMDGVRPLCETDGAEDFQTRALQMYDIITGLK
ncbi:hypothetical protein LINGRAHAP2_LOCUS14628, partial [Linum grandiflorum]